MFQKILKVYRKDLKETLNLAYPIVASQLGIILMGVIDNLMVAKLGTEPLAALGFANHNYFFITIFGIGVFGILPPLVANAKGQSNFQECSTLFSEGLRIAFLLAIFTMIILYVVWVNLGNFGQEPIVAKLAADYFWIIGISTFPLFFIIMLKSFTDGLGFVKISMYISFLGLFLNVIFNWIFIYGKLGFSPMGVIGAGYSTLLVRVMMLIGILSYIFSLKKVKKYLVNLSLTKFNKVLFLKILKLGVPSGLQFFFEIGAFAFAAIMIGWLGAEHLAAHEIALSMIAITFMVVTGLASAGGIRIGEALGRNASTDMFRAGKTSLFLSLVFMTVCCVVFLSFNEFLVSIFMDSESPAFAKLDVNLTISIANSLLIIAGFFQLFDGIQATSAGLLRGLSDVNIPALIGIIVYWCIGLPIAYLLGFMLNQGVWGIWIGLAIGLVMASFLLTFRFFYLLRRISKRFIQTSDKVSVS